MKTKKPKKAPVRRDPKPGLRRPAPKPAPKTSLQINAEKRAAREAVLLPVGRVVERYLSWVELRTKRSPLKIGKDLRFHVAERLYLFAKAHPEYAELFDVLLHSSEFDFIHDMSGLKDSVDPRTGKLLNAFLPRFCRRQTK